MSHDHMVPDGRGGYNVYHHTASNDYEIPESIGDKVIGWVITTVIIIAAITLFIGLPARIVVWNVDKKENQATWESCEVEWANLTDAERSVQINRYKLNPANSYTINMSNYSPTNREKMISDAAEGSYVTKCVSKSSN